MGSESAPPRKRAKPSPEPADAGNGDSLGGLYDFLPPPDPKKDAAAKVAANKNHMTRPKLPPEDRARVIFLDVDGVLLPSGSVDTIVIEGVSLPVREVRESDFAIAALGNLRSIVEKTGATIVLSSEWRRSDQLKSSIGAVLRSQDIPLFRDATPILVNKPELNEQHPVIAWCERRAREIGKWLKEHPDVTAWVALDDLDFDWADRVRAAGTPFIKYRSVHTNDKMCLTDENAADAVRLLLSPPPEPRTAPKRSVLDVPSSEGSARVLVTTEDSLPERIRLG